MEEMDMAVLINLRQLERQNLKLKGELAAAELELEGVDELIRVDDSLKYDLEAQKLEKIVLVQGSLKLTLKCECARCLKPFLQEVDLAGWVSHLALEGEEKALVSNDCVDLTPYMREDILLEFPQRPLCKPECGGLTRRANRGAKKTEAAGQSKEQMSAWAELNKLKL
jgi:uncharacterized metal-binding protein YceD (DUF177 family)